MKKILTLICTLLCANVLLAQTRFWIGDLQYEVTSTSPAEVEVYDANLSITTANIPETVTYQGTTYSVTSIGEYAFSSCSSLTSITIPNSVTSIGDAAFAVCSGLTSITIPNSVTSIGVAVFYNCSSLTSVTLSNNITELPYNYYGFFENCSSLTSVTIPNSVTSIGGAAFAGCSSLTSVNIPNSVTSIGFGAFYNCSSLTSVDIPNSVTSIENDAFYNCSSLTSVTIGNSVTSIGNYTFYGCSSLTSMTIPNSVTSIGNRAFENCSSLTSVTIPNSVTSIGESVFYNCSSLTSVDIPNSVTSIGGAVFYNCSSLTSVTLSNNITELPYFAYLYNVYGFFENCSSLTSITIPNSVTSIGNESFRGCSSLTSVTIPNSVTSIGDYAFDSCSALTSVTIPNSVTSIGDYAFGGCSSLTSVTIGNSVTSIGQSAFNGCSSLTSLSIDWVSVSNSIFSNTGLNISILQNLTLGENVASIASGAFNNYSFLQNVTCLATNPPTLADNTVFPYPNIATLTVPCGTLEAYSSATSFWNMFFMGRISENGYNVEVSVNDETFGSVAVESDCSTSTLTATASDCYEFLRWNDGNTENPRLVSLTSDTSFVATFEEIVFDTTINATINTGETYAEFGFNESESGTYVQNLQTEAGCDSTITLNLTVNSSLYDVAEFAELSVYPNPTSSKVSFNQAIEKVEVIDLSGKTLQTYENANEINIEALPAGVYHLRMTIEDKTTTRKVIKE